MIRMWRANTLLMPQSRDSFFFSFYVQTAGIRIEKEKEKKKRAEMQRHARRWN